MSKKHKTYLLEQIARKVTQLAGSSGAFLIAILLILVWICTGPVFNFSNTWQLVVNSGTTIVTFLMVFLIQRAQNKDSRAIHLKLNELIASLKGPSNRLVDVEDLSEEELETLYAYYRALASMSKKEKDLSVSHSVEEAISIHKGKYGKQRGQAASRGD